LNPLERERMREAIRRYGGDSTLLQLNNDEFDGALGLVVEKEGVKYPPQQLVRKVLIIDEVHMLTPEAFNALLKTLEEPPSSVIFILATTNQEKIPITCVEKRESTYFKNLNS